MKKYWKLIQQHLGVDADGIPGPKTALALLEKLDIRQPEHSWPSQEEVRSGKSVFGRARDESNMTSIKLPYVMRLAWETNTTVSTMRCHKLVAEPLVRIFQAALDHYGMEKIRELGELNRRCVDASKVTDHHAIIPTVEIARTDLSELPSGERDVLTLLAVRLLCATTQVHRFEAVTAILDCQGYTFTAKGKTILQSGWKEVERIHRMSIRQSETEHKENEAVALPVLQEGQTFEAVSASLREGKTSPPKHYTEDTLLSAMETAGAEDMPEDAERKGLGTPATRAATLEKLVSAGFVQRKKKQLIPTEKGKNLIAVLPDNIKSPILTAEWESMLKQVEHGELSATSFMDQIADMSRTLVKEHTTPEERFADLFPSSRGTAHEAVGVCPRCGAPVYEGKKGFFCDNRECSFALWKDNRFFSSKKKSITKSVAAALLKEGRISMSGLYSEKTGRTYDAEVILDDTGGKYVNFKLEFPVKKGRRK